MVQSANDGSVGRIIIEDNRKQVRDKHEQRIKEADAIQPKRFEWTQFVGYVDPMSLKWDKFGTMSITFRVPPEFRDYGMPLLNAGGMLLSVDIQRWNEVIDIEDDDA